MNTTTIRLAEDPDLDTLCDLYYEFHEFHAQHLPNYLRTLDYSSAKEREKLRYKIKDSIQGNDSTILVGDCSGRIIGFAELYLKRPDPTNHAVVPKQYVHLQSLSVTEDFRREGVGNQLLQAAEAWARHRGAVELRLDIWEFSAGPLGFYEKSGYHTFRRTLAKNL
jgi:GNAT superfamily N-acetyltransferase